MKGNFPLLFYEWIAYLLGKIYSYNNDTEKKIKEVLNNIYWYYKFFYTIK